MTCSDQHEAKIARDRINHWLRDFDEAERRIFLSRIKTKHRQHFDAVIWELYLNALFKYLGFHVTRLKDSNGQNTPDFLVRKFRQAFILEATSISDSATRPAEHHWKALLAYLEDTERDDFYIAIHPTKISDSPPQMKSLKTKIIRFLDEQNFEKLRDAKAMQFSSAILVAGEWELEVKAIPKRERIFDGIFIAISGDAKSGLLTTQQDLKSKIEDKRLKYRGLNYPLVIAVLENSLFSSMDDWHRMGALFGQDAIRIGPGNETKRVRIPDGIWDPKNGDMRVSALLLQGRLNIFLDFLEAPEIWVNPKRETKPKILKKTFTSNSLVDFTLVKNPRDFQWDGLAQASLQRRFSRVFTGIMSHVGIFK